MFRADRILSMTFTGSFYRLAPAGYKMDDKGMRGGIIAKADFSEIRRNQQSLVNQNQIQAREEIEMGTPDQKFSSIIAKDTETQLDLLKPMENAILSAEKDINMIRMSFLKSINGNKYIAVMGALGQPGNTVKVKNDKGTQLGVYKVLDSITGQVLKSIKNVKGNAVYDLYLFDKKI